MQAVRCQAYEIARLLIAAPGQEPSRLLLSLTSTGPTSLPLYPDVATGYPLTTADWSMVPSPCPGLAAALPYVLVRSAAEAALLVAHLPTAERCRLRTAAVALHRAQAVKRVALPQPLVWRILTASLA